MKRLFDEGVLSEAGLVVRLTLHKTQLTQAQQAKVDAFLQSLVKNPYAPLGDQIPEPDLLNWLYCPQIGIENIFPSHIQPHYISPKASFTRNHANVEPL